MVRDHKDVHDKLGERILDAALARILHVGIRRASLDDIARRAQVNRVTIYRRFTSKENLIDAVLSREIARILAQVAEIVSTTTGIDTQIELTVMFVLQQTRTHPLVPFLLESTSDEIVGFYTIRGREMVSFGIHSITQLLDRAQEVGAIDRYDPVPVAELLARFAHSVLLTPDGGVDFGIEEQMRDFVRTAVVPLVKYGVPIHSMEHEHADRHATPPSPHRTL
ncbi:TetR/AcrR family transcriptional regulator [Nocardia vinacea]|uniref:TetR/AcrR family transcriptional regulator n=1 Tax=Nocardia vinacea TaxID=96468 RepID=UPI00030E2691|nr:TetR/AcrR family transcriptional regulator [Nocardia vinacea]